MPTFDITSPDGRKFRVQAPEGATQEQALAKVKAQQQPPSPQTNQPGTKQEQGKVPQDIGPGGAFMAGMEDPLVGGRQLFSHVAGSPEDAQKVDEAVRQREAELKARGMPEEGLARGAGRMVSTLPAMAAAGPIGGIAGAAAGGALSEAVMPTTSKDYWTSKGGHMLMGAAFGGAGGAATKAIGGAIAPAVGAVQKELMDKGIKLTPGQLFGGIPRRFEEAAKSFPILGSFIRGAEGRTIENYNTAVINQALEPIGVKLPPTTPFGHEALTFAHNELNDAYNTLLPQMSLSMTHTLASDIANIRYLASSSMPKAQNEQLDNVLRDRVQRYFNNTGTIPGNELKWIERDLTSIASKYRGSSDAAQRDFASALDDVKGVIRDALADQNPKFAPELQKINHAYAMMARVENAAGRRATSAGVFMPSDMLQAIKAGDKTVRKGAFVRGDALMQTFSEYAQNVLPAKMPDSGTTERAAWDIGVGSAIAGGATWLGRPEIPIALGAASAAYTKPGIAAANMLAKPGPTRAAIGQTVRRAAPYMGTGIEPILSQMTGD